MHGLILILICVPRSRADPRWPAVQRQIDLDVARTPCGGAPLFQEHLKAVLEAFALQNGCTYTQVRCAAADWWLQVPAAVLACT